MRSLIVVILSFFSCLSETIGVLTIIPIFLIISGDKTSDSGFVSTIYEYFSEMGLTDNLITILIFFILAITLKSLLKLINSYLIGDTYALIAKEYRLKVMDAIYKAEWNYFVTHSCNVRHKNPDPQWGNVACPQYPANDPYMLPDQYFSK